MKAYLKNYRQSPRKMRLIGNFIKGKSVENALSQLDFLVKRGSEPVKKLLVSAIANAKINDGIEKENLIVKNVLVDKGLVLRRVERKARGATNLLHKRMSNITLILDTKKETIKKPSKAVKVVAKKEESQVKVKSKSKVVEEKN